MVQEGYIRRYVLSEQVVEAVGILNNIILLSMGYQQHSATWCFHSFNYLFLSGSCSLIIKLLRCEVSGSTPLSDSWLACAISWPSSRNLIITCLLYTHRVSYTFSQDSYNTRRNIAKRREPGSESTHSSKTACKSKYGEVCMTKKRLDKSKKVHEIRIDDVLARCWGEVITSWQVIGKWPEQIQDAVLLQ